jgi:hypothetical protein
VPFVVSELEGVSLVPVDKLLVLFVLKLEPNKKILMLNEKSIFVTREECGKRCQNIYNSKKKKKTCLGVFR